MRYRIIAAAVVAAFAAFGLQAPALAAHHSTVPVTHLGTQGPPRISSLDYYDAYYSGAMRDPSDGGINTDVLASNLGTSNAEDWALQSNGTCGGTVTATCPGGWLSTHLKGYDIVTLKNNGQGTLCAGSDAQDGWDVEMATCDGVSGAHHYDTLWVWAPGSSCADASGTVFFSYQWTKDGNNGTAYVTDAAGIGGIITVEPVPPHCDETIWQPLNS